GSGHIPPPHLLHCAAQAVAPARQGPSPTQCRLRTKRPERDAPVLEEALAPALSHITDNRKVEAPKSLIFLDPIFGFCFQKTTLRQRPASQRGSACLGRAPSARGTGLIQGIEPGPRCLSPPLYSLDTVRTTQWQLSWCQPPRCARDPESCGY